MFRKIAVLLLSALFIATAGAAGAQTNYPPEAKVEVRDASGALISLEAGLYPGDPMNVLAEGWKPGTTVTFTFFSDPILLGTRVADANGAVRAAFPVPDVEPGVHTLRMTGTGANGQPRTVDWPVRVLARPTVAGLAQDRVVAASSGGGSNTLTGGTTLGRTGLDKAREMAAIGFALLAIGATLVLAVRRTRRAA